MDSYTHAETTILVCVLVCTTILMYQVTKIQANTT